MPTSETHIRPLLTGLKSDSERVKVWIDVTLEGKAITAELVQAKVNEFIASGEIVEEMEFEEIDTRLDNDVHWQSGKIWQKRRIMNKHAKRTFSCCILLGENYGQKGMDGRTEGSTIG